MKKDQFETSYQFFKENFLSVFPDFAGFREDRDYIAKERDYKDDLMALFREDIVPLLESENWTSAGPALLKLFTTKLPTENAPQNIVGWRYFDPIKNLSEEDLANYALAVKNLINETLSLEQRIDQFLTFFRQLPEHSQLKPAATRSIISFYLTLNDPTKYFFIKTQEFGRILKRFKPDFSWDPQCIQAHEIEDGNILAKHIFARLSDEGWQPQDLIDVQSFLWSAETAVTLEEKLAVELIKENTNMAAIKNQIFYGPPGTGKTYKLQKILDDDYTVKGVLPDKRLWLISRIEKLSWFEVIALILLGSDRPMKVADITGHEYYQLKAEINEREQNLRATAWAALQSHAIADSETVKLTKRNEPLVFDKTEADSLWYIDDSAEEQLEDLKLLRSELIAGPENTETINRFEFVTFHQSYGYEEFIEGLRPVTNTEGDISYEIKPGVFKRICKRAEADPDNSYAIVIDEINRGNISKIFGELMTLIEVDKRAGAKNELSVTLPYSGAPFSVPSNLDIIGTMNTADRSLTHIDVALRRRFEFKELRTDYSLISTDVEGINLRRMLYAMNQRIELLLDRDHILGHATLMKVSNLDDLRMVFKTNFMPLLQEYFFENWEKIDQVLNNNGFIEEQKNANNVWLGNNDEYSARFFSINTDALDISASYQGIYANVDAAAFVECDKAIAES